MIEKTVGLLDPIIPTHSKQRIISTTASLAKQALKTLDQQQKNGLTPYTTTWRMIDDCGLSADLLAVLLDTKAIYQVANGVRIDRGRLARAAKL